MQKHWCFTVNNPTEEDGRLLHESFEAGNIEYVVIGHEKGEEGTPHIQGYLCLKVKLRMTGVKKMLPRAHLEGMKGTPQQASDYCKKEGNWQEYGTLPMANGKKGGLATKERYATAKRLAIEGNLDAIDEDIYIKHYTTLKKIRMDHMEAIPAMPDVTGVWYHGITGAGKSTRAREEFPNYFLKAANKWWDGYDNQDNVILEDLDKTHHVLGHYIKLWADKHDFVCESKGHSMRIRPKNFIITSQYEINDIWPDVETRAALHRRFRIVHVLRTPAMVLM